MTDSQKKYEQTEKGKAARRKATENYQSKKVMVKAYFEPEVYAALQAKYPEMSNSALVNQLAKESLGIRR